ncbi:hypothetical protein Tco_1326153 [Tanacetum coccineum]
MNDAMPITYSYYKAYSSVKRPFNKKTTNYNKYFNKRVNTVKSTRVNTARSKAYVNTVKASDSWVWKPKHEELDHVFKSNSALKTLTRYDYVDALEKLKLLCVTRVNFGLLNCHSEVAVWIPLKLLLLKIVLEGVSDKQQVIRVWRSGYIRNIWQLVKKYDFNAVSGFENWQATKDRRIFRCSFHFNTTNELAIPEQTTTGKESSNPFMAGSLPKTIHLCDSLQSDEDNLSTAAERFSEDASKQGRIHDAYATVTKEQKVDDDKETTQEVRKSKELKICSEGINISDSEDKAKSQPRIEKKTIKPSFAKIKFVKSKEQVKSPRKTTVKQGDQNRLNTHIPRGNQRN